MKRRNFLITVGGAWASNTRLLAAEAPTPSVVAEWNEVLISAARKEATSPCLLAIKLALLHKGFHEALPKGADEGPIASIQAAATIAAALFPTSEPAFLALANKHLACIPSGQEKNAELTRGAGIGRTLLEARKGDGVATSQPYIPSAVPGQWQRTPPAFRPPELPNWSSLTKPFLLAKADQFRPPPPPALSSQEYASSWDEVRRFGSKTSSDRSPGQTAAAKFWSDFSYTETPPGHWNAITRGLAQSQRLSLAEESRLFCLLNLAMADGAIACWDAKYHYNAWRPVTAIVRADEDGNEATAKDTAWESLLPSPPHPEYVSGHSVFSGAAVEVLHSRFDKNALKVRVGSDTLKESVREFENLSVCLQEVSLSRIWGGIHFRFSVEAGVDLGRAVARECIRKFGNS